MTGFSFSFLSLLPLRRYNLCRLAGVNVLVCGAGTFIGGHFVKKLVRNGGSARAVDIKRFFYSSSACVHDASR